ncbi:uncharacterized protein NDAI_0J01290 [Naumovozyma dairenensis CBS 421]|uniref:Uncharacterized protein n=1 Tax=Naumovozyma dairenensis (strain ATCC 10597 / BCRC 20456 / CBS 421 / NBRC 0211 / NRRL Y-12639) TaxID=1071378 RepID=G0WGU3_NAUDC|nr:hypothetical protein NDAI_0J01290 [Naumovozyma dairenensis CBS 421]CCD27021.1 hypothetical protein NDAI_0J01290 [Naumovozyma dairenensis CBS 421]
MLFNSVLKRSIRNTAVRQFVTNGAAHTIRPVRGLPWVSSEIQRVAPTILRWSTFLVVVLGWPAPFYYYHKIKYQS